MSAVDRCDFLAVTRDGYDRTAVSYAERFRCHLDDKPLDLAVLNAAVADAIYATIDLPEALNRWFT